ncbi:hypothetical protein [Bacillus sp. V5-8f]|uniref:hypothetical protein n=1 Tax=Bacillus sp. V5-8f TaxID=2053044 RepID=UPI000C7615EF|nr:hypothetical protein [Bacillus sp. V5-8f]PLT31989.1 hypothetical protein CUU64_20600 [Bacillus sp. V5-8f]
MSRRRNRSSFILNLFAFLFVFILIGMINGYTSLTDFITTERKHKKLKESFNENEFRQKLMPPQPVIEALKQEFPAASIETTKSGFSQPTSLEDFEIENGETGVYILVSTYHKGTYLDFVHDSNVEFNEIEGKLQYIYINAITEDTAIDSLVMKKIFKAISTGLGYGLNDNQIADLTSALKDENSVSPYPNPYLTYDHQNGVRAGGGRHLPWNDVLIRSVQLQLLDDEEVEKAFKVMYNITE